MFSGYAGSLSELLNGYVEDVRSRPQDAAKRSPNDKYVKTCEFALTPSAPEAEKVSNKQRSATAPTPMTGKSRYTSAELRELAGKFGF